MKNNLSILVVDDEQMMRDLLARILTRDGYRVTAVADGQAALEALKTSDAQLVISDMKTPGIEGFQLLKRLKQDHPQLGIIVITAHGDTYTVKDALLHGADEYLTKPFKAFEVSLVVERAYWRLLSSGRTAPEVTETE